MYGDLGDGMVRLFWIMVITIVISVPLGLWKVWDIAVWTWNNVSVTVK